MAQAVRALDCPWRDVNRLVLTRALNITVATVIAGRVKHIRTTVEQPCWRRRPAGDFVHHPVLEQPTTTATETTTSECA